MRPQFRYNLISIKAVFTGVIMSSIVFRIFNGEAPIIEVGKLSDAPVNTLWLYLILGIILAASGRYLIRWCCVPGICFSAFMAAKLKMGAYGRRDRRPVRYSGVD